MVPSMLLQRLSKPCCVAILLVAQPLTSRGQQSPYDIFPEAKPPYYRVRYEASTRPGKLIFPVNYTIWIPPTVKTLRGVVVHQHGCGEGSCKSSLTGAYDLHWQALAKKHDCALLAPAYEQPEGANCQMWCDPRNGSAATFQRCLVDLGEQSGHDELANVPWALWGHSGGGHWAGGMVMLRPKRVVAAWLRSGVPLLRDNPSRPDLKAHSIPPDAMQVPIMCNLGTKEGVSVKDGRFSRVWPANQVFFDEVRGKGGLVGVAVDPLTGHECGNQRYLAIPWMDECLSKRLPIASGKPLHAMPTDDAWHANPTGTKAFPAAEFSGNQTEAAWLPNESIANLWMEYVNDTAVSDTTLPPSPANLLVTGNKLTWDAEADVESGLARFIINRDGKFLANVPEVSENRFGRPLFQNLQYSDTPTQPLVSMHFTDESAERSTDHIYEVVAVNTVGLESRPTSSRPTAAKSWRSGTHTINVDGIDREFLLDVPLNLQPNAALVFVFHGYTGSAKSFRQQSGFAALANQHGFVAVYPQGTRDARGKTFFNVGYAFHSKNLVDDVKFTQTLAERLVNDLGLDSNAVFATGMSNGGDMSYFLASQNRPVVRAIAPVAGTMMKTWGQNFKPAIRIPVLHIHGTKDSITLWEGDIENRDGWGAYLSLDDVLHTWIGGMKLEKNQVTRLSHADDNSQSIQLHRWSTATDKTEVRLYRIENGRHVWPQHLDNPKVTTGAVIWEFFDSHR